MITRARNFILSFLTILISAGGAAPGAGDWPWWRGPNRNGVAQGAGYPIAWSKTQNVLLAAKLPLGGRNSTPTRIGQHMLLTTADEQAKTQSVLCLARATGQLR